MRGKRQTKDDHAERRLVAILAVDVVGYSRMMASDEAATLTALKHHRRSIFDPTVAGHNGRVVKLMGDGALVQFGSVVDAVSCALALQRGQPPGVDPALPQIVLRIGINVGDVRVDGEDIYGDGVNVAARLEPLAEPGGICVTSIVKESIVGRINVLFEDGGEVQLKNIGRPIRIWKWRPLLSKAASSEVPNTHMDALRPSLAVLPFESRSDDSRDGWFVEGVVDDIITALSRFRSFAVIARNSSFAYKQRSMDVRQIARELDVRYILNGSVRRANDRLRITAQLVEAETGNHLWANKLDGVLDDVFDFQDEITSEVAAIVAPHIEQAEIERSLRERPGSITSYDVYLRARALILGESEKGNERASTMLIDAIEADPDHAGLLSLASWALEHRLTMGWEMMRPDDHERCVAYARRGLELANGDTMVMAHCGIALVQIGREYDWGMAVLSSAAEVNPNNLSVIVRAGVANLHCGSVEDALTFFHRANLLSPRDPFAHISLCGIAHGNIVLGKYEEALRWALRAIAVNPNFDATYWMLIAANAHLGRMDVARHYVSQLQRQSPGVTIERIRSGQPAKDPTRLGAILEGLDLAGLPVR